MFVLKLTSPANPFQTTTDRKSSFCMLLQLSIDTDFVLQPFFSYFSPFLYNKDYGEVTSIHMDLDLFYGGLIICK